MAIEVVVGDRSPVRISNYSPNSRGCVELFYTPPDPQPLFLFFLKGLPVSVRLLKGEEYVFSEPSECVLGTRNAGPDSFLSWASFCQQTVPLIFDISSEEEDEDEVDDADDDEEVKKEEE